jgi:transposase, IS5 family
LRISRPQCANRLQVQGLMSGQKRRLAPQTAIEPVIGHLKPEHRVGAINTTCQPMPSKAVLAVAGYNFRLLLKGRELLRSRFLAGSIRSGRPQWA